ncbi:restriction endonuclease [Clostridium boliviensis]|uniref:Restriction endonuclease n=1 Tax=Clostridium boliviensis TaxID=318465 RepID=A0ABU4GS97_9CLOT|nr:restriction endonuclease [Clostridium boliviensis]MDW2800501.1 restriction endonuclease [Clostridium boliviensis]
MKNKRYSKRRYSKKNSHLQLIVLLIFFVSIFQGKFSKNQILFNTYSKWLLVAFCLLFIGKIIFAFYNKQKKLKKYLYSRIFEIDKMSGPDFEKLLKAHFEKKGYSVRLTPASNDYGADLVLIKDNSTTVVQAKRYKNKIGNKAIQEIVGAKGYYNADKCMVISNSFYTANAIALAKANNVTLWNRNDLIDNFKIE